MKTVYLHRMPSTTHGTFGKLTCPEVGFSCFSGEPPWKDNRTAVSCIPDGEYEVKIRQSPKFGTSFHVTNVPGRSYILIHSGAYCGDKELKLLTHSSGCILLGKSIGKLSGQRALFNSRLAVAEFKRAMNNEPFKLIVKWC